MTCLSVSGCRHAVVAGLGDDPEHPAYRVLMTCPHGGQLDWSGTSTSVKERQLAVLHTAAEYRLVLGVVFDRREMMRWFQHQLR